MKRTNCEICIKSENSAGYFFRFVLLRNRNKNNFSSGNDGYPGSPGKSGQDALERMITDGYIDFCFECPPGAPGSPGEVGHKGPEGVLGPSGKKGKTGQSLPGPGKLAHIWSGCKVFQVKIPFKFYYIFHPYMCFFTNNFSSFCKTILSEKISKTHVNSKTHVDRISPSCPLCHHFSN